MPSFNFLHSSLCLIILLWGAKKVNTVSAEAVVDALHMTEDGALSQRYVTGAEYLSISNIALTEKKNDSPAVRFKVAWEGSWRDAENYDAAWLFCKVKTATGSWEHVKINPKAISILANRTSNGVSPAFDCPTDRVGCFIFRATNSSGTNEWEIEIGLDLPTEADIAEIQVFGLEMVYVPTGTFELGTTKSIRQRREVLTPGAGGAPYNSFFTFSTKAKDQYGGVFKVISEEVIPIGTEDGYLFWEDAQIRGANTFSGIPEGRLESNFPKGYQGFYQMKYELSQKQYADFLNTLSPVQQQNRTVLNEIEYKRSISDYRNALRLENGQYRTDRPNRPCNFISWKDGQAYADWAGLRHMTELEFEKACRGPQPAVYREYVWGVNEITQKQNMRYSTSILNRSGELAADEADQVLTDGNLHASMFSYFNIQDVCVPGAPFYDPDCAGCRGFQGGDGGRGPLRNGIFGLQSKGDRINAGATYYGAMDMGGNLQEPVVTVGHPSGRKFQGTHGDGTLSESGEATNPDWQPVDGAYAFAGRGGCWKFHENHARVADRFKGLRTKPDRRASHIGFRGVRTK